MFFQCTRDCVWYWMCIPLHWIFNYGIIWFHYPHRVIMMLAVDFTHHATSNVVVLGILIKELTLACQRYLYGVRGLTRTRRRPQHAILYNELVVTWCWHEFAFTFCRELVYYRGLKLDCVRGQIPSFWWHRGPSIDRGIQRLNKYRPYLTGWNFAIGSEPTLQADNPHTS